jgi:hypothetical protein
VTAQHDWQRWCDRFDKTQNGVIRLFHDRAIWRTILAMLDANPKVARGGFGEYWLESCYTDSMLIGIQRSILRAWPATPEWPAVTGTSGRSGNGATRTGTPGNWPNSTPDSTSSLRPASLSSTPRASGRTSPR